MKCSRPRGFTLLELLVCIAIIGVLSTLVLSAVMQARSAARRLSCQNNMRQIGTALQAFETANGRYPGVYCGIIGPNRTVLWSFSPSSVTAYWLDGEALASQVRYSQPIFPPDPDWSTLSLSSPAVLRCPDDALATAKASSYRYCRGIFPLWPEDPGGVFVRNDEGVRTADITDGLSNTAFCSERLVSDPAVIPPERTRGLLSFDARTTPDISLACWQANADPGASAGVPWSQEPAGTSWMSGRWLHASYYHLFPPNTPWRDCRENDLVALAVITARSNHEGGVNVGCGDGSVRFVRNGVSLPVWRALATRRGNDFVDGAF